MTVVCKMEMKFPDVLGIMQQIMVLMKATSAKSQYCQVEMKGKRLVTKSPAVKCCLSKTKIWNIFFI